MHRFIARPFVALVLFATIALSAVALPARPAAAAGFCQCTTFVANYYGLQHTYPNANAWGGWLPSQGKYLSQYIAAGDIMVLQAGVSGAGSVGHVAVVAGATDLGGGYWRITMRSANWSGSGADSTVANCTNVSDDTVTVQVGTGGVAFYH